MNLKMTIAIGVTKEYNRSAGLFGRKILHDRKSKVKSLSANGRKTRVNGPETL